LDGLPFESHRIDEFVLSGDHFVEVFVRMQTYLSAENNDEKEPR
jgi:hypothetical protein